MAKRSSTIYLEEKFWNMVDKYQSDNNLSSRNDAFQMILSEWNMLSKIDFNNIKVSINIDSVETSNNKPNVQDITKYHSDIQHIPKQGGNDTNDKPIENKSDPEVEEKTIDPRISSGILKIQSTMIQE